MDLNSTLKLLRREPAHWLSFSEEERQQLKQDARLETVYVNGTFVPLDLGFNTGPRHWTHGPSISHGCNDGIQGARGSPL